MMDENDNLLFSKLFCSLFTKRKTKALRKKLYLKYGKYKCSRPLGPAAIKIINWASSSGPLGPAAANLTEGRVRANLAEGPILLLIA